MSPPATPSRSRAMIPPIREPARPSPIVAYQGIGSGPGSASRARPPTMKPHTISPMMKNTMRLPALAQLLADEEDALQDSQPGRRRQEVDGPLQDAPGREHEPRRDRDNAFRP